MNRRWLFLTVLGLATGARAETLHLACNMNSAFCEAPSGKKCVVTNAPTKALLELDLDKKRYIGVFRNAKGPLGTLTGDIDSVGPNLITFKDVEIKPRGNRIRHQELSRLDGHYLLKDPVNVGFNLYGGVCEPTKEELPKPKF